MAAKAVEEYKVRQIQARRCKLAQLTSLQKQTEQLMEYIANVNIEKISFVLTLVACRENFKSLILVCKKFMDEEEYVDDQRFNPKNDLMDDFFWRCEGWIKDFLNKQNHNLYQWMLSANLVFIVAESNTVSPSAKKSRVSYTRSKG